MATLTNKFSDTRTSEAYIYAQGRVDAGDDDISPLAFSLEYTNKIKVMEMAGTTKRWPSLRNFYNEYVEKVRAAEAKARENDAR